MDCIHCDIGLEQEYLHGVTVDACPKCGCIWFDVGELEMFKYRMDKKRLRRLKKSSQFEQMSPITLYCPKCRTDSLEMGEIGGHKAGRCSECLGVWVSQEDWTYPPPGLVEAIVAMQIRSATSLRRNDFTC